MCGSVYLHYGEIVMFVIVVRFFEHFKLRTEYFLYLSVVESKVFAVDGVAQKVVVFVSYLFGKSQFEGYFRFGCNVRVQGVFYRSDLIGKLPEATEKRAVNKEPPHFVKNNLLVGKILRVAGFDNLLQFFGFYLSECIVAVYFAFYIVPFTAQFVVIEQVDDFVVSLRYTQADGVLNLGKFQKQVFETVGDKL